jgi:arylamine N-acetyltransferase
VIVITGPYRRYLRLLGMTGQPKGLDGLRRIVSRHVSAVPFENISKLLLYAREGAGRFLTLHEFLDGIEHHDLGGTCHSANPYLAELLRALGYDAALMGADMSQPNVHTCVRVHIEGAAYHIDAGYGGPFREPVPLHSLPYQVVDGADRYVFHRASDGRLALTHYSGSKLAPGYTVNDTPRPHDFFTHAMLGSFKPTAVFMTNLRICRIFKDRSAMLFNRTLAIQRGAESATRELNTSDEWSAALAHDLQLPRCPWPKAVKILEQNTARPFFEAS